MSPDTISSKRALRNDRSNPATQQLAARKTREHLTFDEWLAALDGAALTAGFRCRLAATSGAECWRDYYEEGMTPDEALAEDWSYA